MGESVAGGDATTFETGQEVYGLNDWFADGAMAEYCTTKPSSVASKPPRLTHIEAASVPIGALTAWQGLFDRAKLQAGERVLVHGGAGAAGVFAMQIARFYGARVIATASARNIDFVSRLGAEQVIDYRAARFEERLQDIDVVFDTVGGETLERSWGVLKPGGRIITIASDGASSSAGRRCCRSVCSGARRLRRSDTTETRPGNVSRRGLANRAILTSLTSPHKKCFAGPQNLLL